MRRPKQLPAVDRSDSTKTATVMAGANLRPALIDWCKISPESCGIYMSPPIVTRLE